MSRDPNTVQSPEEEPVETVWKLLDDVDKVWGYKMHLLQTQGRPIAQPDASGVSAPPRHYSQRPK